MPIKTPRSYELTPSLVAAFAGGPVVCLAAYAIGRSYRLHTERPGVEANRRADVRRDGSVAWSAVGLHDGRGAQPAGADDGPRLTRVDIMGPLEQRAGYHDECGGWSDGHDAVAERLCAALAEGDVLLVGDTPGGAAAGIQQAVTRVAATKYKLGRRVTGWADEQIASAGVWWMASVCDEIFIPSQGAVGSVGARGSHTSIAGALAKEGIATTHFAYPADKIAFAPEFPLSKEGMRRGMRDVRLVADAFLAAVCASPIGVRRGITSEHLLSLKADMFTGQAAVDVGLSDGISTLEEVTAYAMALADREENKMKERPNG